MSLGLVYLGNDSEMIKGLSTLVDKRSAQSSDWEFTVIEDVMSGITECCQVDLLGLLIVDFTCIQQQLTRKFCQEMILFKNMPGHRGVPIVGVFSDRKHLAEMEILFSTGVCMAHIRGADSKLFFKDIVYLMSGHQEHFGSFATAKRLEFPYEVMAYGNVTHLSVEQLWIDSDISLPEVPQIKFAAFCGSYPQGLNVVERISQGSYYDSLHSQRLQIEYPGAWDLPQDNTLMIDTFETWISHHTFEEALPRALLFTKNSAVALKALKENSLCELDVSLCSDEEILCDRLKAVIPQIILIDIPVIEETNLYCDILTQVIEQSTQTALIVLWNSQMTQDEWRGHLASDKVLVSSGSLEAEVLMAMLDVCRKKMAQLQLDTTFHFKISDPESLVQVNLPVWVTSFSEHEMTFFCEVEIPMFSVLYLPGVADCYLLVIPQFRNLSTGTKGTHYQAILHGMDQAGEERLRQYVNAIIFERPEKFGVMPELAQQHVALANNLIVQENGIGLPKILPQITKRVVQGKSKL